MKVAMPTFGNRVSPRFDCSNSLLVVTTRGQQIVDRRELNVTAFTPRDRIAQLLSMGVEVVVCGGIDRCSAESLRDAGVTLYSEVTDTSEAALAALLSGKLAQQHVIERPATRRRDAMPDDRTSIDADVNAYAPADDTAMWSPVDHSNRQHVGSGEKRDTTM
jgi:predicted Fe-Mo cluster-binding NifX family protein